MAPTDEGTIHQKAENDAANPFVAFRRFADEQMSNLMSGIFGLSLPSRSSSTSPDHAFHDYQSWLREARASRQQLQRESEEAVRIMDVCTNACKDSAQHSELSLAGFRDHLPHTILAAPLLGKEFPSVPVGYLLYSPYSPVRLEHHRSLSNRGMHWREAFEDLLAVQNGEGLIEGRERDTTSSNIDWVSGMIELAMSKKDWDECDERMTTPPWRAPFIATRLAAEKRSQNDAVKENESQVHENPEDDAEHTTELDMYNHFLGPQTPSSSPAEVSASSTSTDSYSRSHSRSVAHLQHNTVPSKNDSGKPSILSTLTTTERTTLQDGAIHTKVVLKKRFSDGREESTETMHTQNPSPQPQYQPPTKAIEQQGNSHDSMKLDSKDKKAKGWFWS